MMVRREKGRARKMARLDERYDFSSTPHVIWLEGLRLWAYTFAYPSTRIFSSRETDGDCDSIDRSRGDSSSRHRHMHLTDTVRFKAALLRASAFR